MTSKGFLHIPFGCLLFQKAETVAPPVCFKDAVKVSMERKNTFLTVLRWTLVVLMCILSPTFAIAQITKGLSKKDTKPEKQVETAVNTSEKQAIVDDDIRFSFRMEVPELFLSIEKTKKETTVLDAAPPIGKRHFTFKKDIFLHFAGVWRHHVHTRAHDHYYHCPLFRYGMERPMLMYINGFAFSSFIFPLSNAPPMG
ncbi:MAG: hypothetical protein QM610_04090 [Chitinophagaceae bacterium]